MNYYEEDIIEESTNINPILEVGFSSASVWANSSELSETNSQYQVFQITDGSTFVSFDPTIRMTAESVQSTKRRRHFWNRFRKSDVDFDGYIGTKKSISNYHFSPTWSLTTSSFIKEKSEIETKITPVSDLISISRMIFQNEVLISEKIVESLDNYMLKRYPNKATLPGRS